VVDAALDAGITLFDVADIYGSPAGASEEMLGAALGSRRADVVVATKFGMEARGPTVPISVPGAPGGTCGWPWRTRCGGCGPTGSTCSSCTRSTR
jgi:aryl-alcohol dehydrogenase-like predicted oxidoreductase